MARDGWDRLAGDDGFCLSYDWLRFATAASTSGTCLAEITRRNIRLDPAEWRAPEVLVAGPNTLRRPEPIQMAWGACATQQDT